MSIPEEAKAFIAYINDAGPTLAVFTDKDQVRAYARELTRILAWRSLIRDEDDEDDEDRRRSYPPEDWSHPLLDGPHHDWTVTWYEAPLDLPAIQGARETATDFNTWGEYEP